jgi:hypothetical protein
MAIVIFSVAIIWGSLSAQFLVQVTTSLVVSLVYLAGIALSKVSRAMNLMGALTSFGQSIIFGILFVGGSWLISEYVIDFDRWNAASIASLLSFLGTIIYVSPQVPGKVLLARMCAWVPDFMQASMRVPAAERIAFARRWRAEFQRLESQH